MSCLLFYEHPMLCAILRLASNFYEENSADKGVRLDIITEGSCPVTESGIWLKHQLSLKNRHLKHARISGHEFHSILELFCADVEALKASRFNGVNKNTTHRVYGLLRKRVVEWAHAESAPFAGCVEVDESYFGPWIRWIGS
jgi:hypothetical protein